MSQYVYLVLAFLTALIVAFVTIPSIIFVAREKHLMDEPGERSSHRTKIPTLGGFSIFGGLIMAITLWVPFDNNMRFVLAPLIIMFLVGAKDDLVTISPSKKILGQVLAACILTMLGDIRFTSLYGFFWIWEVPAYVGIPFTIFYIIVLTNSVNLIDGINGLCALVGVTTSFTFGVWFLLNGSPEAYSFSVLASSLVGALVGFLYYNYKVRASIFMGDTGSLILGMMLSILSIKFMELNRVSIGDYNVSAVPVITLCVLILPIFDAGRVFLLRTLDGRSPFSADRNHHHHLLIDLGFSHLKATNILVSVNILFIAIGFSLYPIGTLPFFIIVLGLAILLSSYLTYINKHK